MKYIIPLFLILFLISPVYAIDKKIGATNIFKIGVFDISSKGNGIAGLTYTTDVVIKIQCGTAGITTVNGTGDTFTSEGGGYYYLSTNDSITNTNEDECIAWAEGAGNYAGLIAKTPIKFKAVGKTTETISCDISAATSSSSFTIASCVDEDNASITLATDMFVGQYAIAYTNGSAQCNVIGQGVFISDVTAGVVTVKTTDMPGSDFSATPNTTNCGVRINP